MLRDITLGQYYPADSVVHKLDPRVKLFGTFLFIIALFVASDAVSFCYMVLLLASAIILCKVPFGFMVRGLRAILLLIFVAAFFNLFFTPGKVLVSFHGITITLQGIQTAVLMTGRMVCLIIGTSIMTLTTTPNALTDGLERSMRFLKVFHVPVHEIAMMMSIALRFIPILIEETDKIMKAQMARGADFETGGLFKKAKAMIPLLVPLFVSAFRRANDLALAMEARCYHGGEGRTKMNPLKYEKRDRAAYLVYFLAFLILILLVVLVRPRVLGLMVNLTGLQKVGS